MGEWATDCCRSFAETGTPSFHLGLTSEKRSASPRAGAGFLAGRPDEEADGSAGSKGRGRLGGRSTGTDGPASISLLLLEMAAHLAFCGAMRA